MKTLSILSMILVFAVSAHADSWKTVNVVKNQKNYEFSYSYPKLNANASPEYKKINDVIVSEISQGCGEITSDFAPTDETPWWYGATALVRGLNKNYIAIEVGMGTDCGGAHPDSGSAYYTFDTKTGQVVSVEKGLGLNYDEGIPDSVWDKDSQIQTKLAEIIAKHMDTTDMDPECYPGTTFQDLVDDVENYFPTVGSLARNKQVILTISPGHAALACSVEVRVGYNELKDLIVPGSVLENWLK